ncbi:protein transporter SEC24 [Colletotrichum tofieldiae]|nr:protein transporter SEC24 [Colletotrichum tofieldiae]
MSAPNDGYGQYPRRSSPTPTSLRRATTHREPKLLSRLSPTTARRRREGMLPRPTSLELVPTPPPAHLPKRKLPLRHAATRRRRRPGRRLRRLSATRCWVPCPGGAPAAPGVAGLNQQMAGMNLGGNPQQPPPGQPAGTRPMALNQLYPTDLMNQPFNVSELDLPPPPIVLPPNTSVTPSPDANCGPKYVRSTLNAVPTTHSLLKKSRLPFALVIQPYGALHDSEDPVPVVQDQVIARCRRCRTYINPFVTFLDHGHRWRCNMCNLTNDVPQAFDWDAASQRSTDRWGRYELNYSVVEFVAPQEYMVRPPQPLVYLFLFDVSYAAVSTGLLATSARTILDSLDRIPNADRRTRLGFIAVDSSLHYFSVPKDGEENAETSMLVVSDLDEPFLPVPKTCWCP